MIKLIRIGSYVLTFVVGYMACFILTWAVFKYGG